MSIYSGFATRQQEQLYDSYVEKILITLQNLVQQLLDSHKPHHRFCSSFSKIYITMKKMESCKYLKPKLTECLNPIYKLCQSDLPVQHFKNSINDNLEPNIGSRLKIQHQLSSLSDQRNLMLQFQSELHKGTDDFRLRRPCTTKYSSSSTGPRRSIDSRTNMKQRDGEMRRSFQNHFQQAIKNRFKKAQKHHIRMNKYHQKQFMQTSTPHHRDPFQT